MKRIVLLFLVLVSFSCSRNSNEPSSLLNETAVENIEALKFHEWYYFTDNRFESIDLPQNAPVIKTRPWTEAVRISSAAGAPVRNGSSPYTAYAVVNHKGVLAFSEQKAELYGDDSLFPEDTADGLVFSSGHPVFYFYRSTFFFNDVLNRNTSIQKSRPFLVEFDSATKNFYPLVTYDNMQLEPSDQIINYFWDGKTWVCCAKRNEQDTVEFKYLSWQPPLALSDINPALGGETFYIKMSNESVYLKLSLPKLFDEAPEQLRKLLAPIPENFGFYISWRDNSGTSPVSYFHQGSTNASINAKAASFPLSGMMAALFPDGTTYICSLTDEKTYAFRLPKLPSGFVYGEFAIAGNTLYASWEENDFYLTGRAGFIKVDLSKL